MYCYVALSLSTSTVRTVECIGCSVLIEVCIINTVVVSVVRAVLFIFLPTQPH